MKYNINSIVNNYNSFCDCDEKINNNDIFPIFEKLDFIASKLDFDDVEMITLVDTLMFFYNKGYLSKVNEESLSLLSRVNGNEEGFYEEDKDYFCLRMKHLLVPFNVNKCDYEHNIVKYLAEMDIMLNNMSLELNEDDLILLKKYNEELYNVLVCYKNVLKEFENTLNIQYISDNVIINSTLSHLASMLYFCLDRYEYHYELLEKVFKKIMNNYQEYLLECRNYGIYTDRTAMIFNPENVYNEYVICKDMLDDELGLKVKILKKY